MDWVKLACRYYLDMKIANLPDADAEVMFTRSIAYCGAEETSGFIPAGVVPSLSRRRRYETSRDALLAAGLWLPSSRGYVIPRWVEWQAELEAIARRRSADRDRKRRKRAEQRETTGTPHDLHVRRQSADSPADSPPESLYVSRPVVAESGDRETASADSPPPRRPRRSRGGTPGDTGDRWYASGQPNPDAAARGADLARSLLRGGEPDG